MEEASKEMVSLLAISGAGGASHTPLPTLPKQTNQRNLWVRLFEPILLYMEKHESSEEKALKALNDVTEELRLMQNSPAKHLRKNKYVLPKSKNWLLL